MEKIKLKATPREEIGKEKVKKLRALGLIPAVVYKGKNSLNIKVSAKDLNKVIHTKAGENVVVSLEIEDAKTKKPKTVIIKEIQYHVLKGDTLHIDFNEISLTEVLTIKVPIAAKGEPKGAKEGGVLEHVFWELEVECLPEQIPENILIDINSMEVGDSILVKDLKIPAGVKVLADPEATVVSLAIPHVEEAAEVVPGEEVVEPEMIMEKKPEEEEAAAEEAKAPEKEKKEKKEKA
ncbi:MAG: 50S ribosomal protein L25 [Omnitrophica bacterium]|nr:50S ribosomal protein L25 [Candidatus Omnitrophota bacterium]